MYTTIPTRVWLIHTGQEFYYDFLLWSDPPIQIYVYLHINDYDDFHLEDLADYHYHLADYHQFNYDRG